MEKNQITLIPFGMGSGLLKKKNTGVWEGDSALLTAAVKINAESATILIRISCKF